MTPCEEYGHDYHPCACGPDEDPCGWYVCTDCDDEYLED